MPSVPGADNRSLLSKAYDQANPFDRGKTFVNAAPIQKPQIPQYLAAPKTASDLDRFARGALGLGYGAARSLQGTVQGVGGLYDLATPGMGQNRVTTFAADLGKKTDVQAQKLQLPATYKAGQFLGEIAQIGMTKGVSKAAVSAKPVISAFGKTEKLGKIIKASNLAQKAAEIAKLNRGTEAATKLAKYIATPSRVLNIGANTLIDQGRLSSTGEKITPTSLATSAALNYGLGSVADIASKSLSILKNKNFKKLNEGGYIELPGGRREVVVRDPRTSPELAEEVQAGRISDDIKLINPKDIKRGGGVQGARPQKKVVDEYMDKIERDESIDPLIVSVNKRTGKVSLEDGQNRLKAMNKYGITEVPVVVQRDVLPKVTTRQLSGAAQQAQLAKRANLAREAAHTGQIKNIYGEWVDDPSASGQGGYLSLGGNKKRTPEEYRMEIKNRIQEEYNQFSLNKDQWRKDTNNPSAKAQFTENGRMFKEFLKNPDAFVDKYDLMPPGMQKPKVSLKTKPAPEAPAPTVSKGKPVATKLTPKTYAQTFGVSKEQAVKDLAIPPTPAPIKADKAAIMNKPKVKAIEQIMRDEGIGKVAAKDRLNVILKESTATDLKDVIKQGEPVKVTGNPAKNPQVREVLQGLSKSKGKADVEGSQVAGSISTKARELGVSMDRGFIDRYQAGNLKGNEKLLGDHIVSITDTLFKKQASLDPSIQYRKNYVPQVYKNTSEQIASAVNKLASSTGAANRRVFNTYKEAEAFGLTPKYKTIDQIMGVNAQKAETVLQNRTLVKKGIESGVLSTDPGAGAQVIGIKGPGGSPIFAQKEVADTLNGVMQSGTGTLVGGIRKTAGAAGLAQDVMLQGGIPGTNANFFVAGQLVKDTTRNIGKAYLRPIQAIKQEANLVGDFLRGKNATQARFTQGTFKAGGAKINNSNFVRALADQGLYISPQTALSATDKNGVRKVWDSFGNNPTFGRYMPNRVLSTAQEVYSQTVKKIGHDAAIKLAADTTKTFTGQVDTILKGRSNLANDLASLALFAPKYRESILNSLTNIVKSIYPTKWTDPAFKPSRQLLAGMVTTLAGYEALNRKINNHSMFENRQGQELSLQIPYGEKDDKGNQKVVNVPFMPGFMTIPRAIGSAGAAIKSGDVQGVVAQGSKVLSAPLQIIGNVSGNRDYFDRPIYMDQKSADAEGVAPDSIAAALKKTVGYVGGQLSPAWVRGVIDKASGKPTEQAIATALEAPVRFGKQLNPETVAYFKDRDEVYSSLDKNDRAVWDAIHPKLKNVNKEYIVDKSVDSGLARASNYLDRPKVLEAENEMARRAKARGQKVDPLFDLPQDQQRIALRMDTLPPKDPNKTVLRKQNPWYSDYTSNRSAFFDSLPPGDPNKPKGPILYPEPSAQVQSLVDAYYQIKDPTQKRNMITSNPEIADQFAKEEQYSRAVRAAKNLPQYDKYPEPSQDVQRLLDFYTSMPKGEGPNGKSPTRSAWIKAHPQEWEKLTQQFSKQAQYGLQRDASIAQFEGQDLTEGGIKDIQSLAKSLGMSSGGGFGGFGQGPRDITPSSYAKVSKPKAVAKVKLRGAPARIARVQPAIRLTRPKVTIKKSKV
jgi:hypothetical protein